MWKNFRNICHFLKNFSNHTPIRRKGGCDVILQRRKFSGNQSEVRNTLRHLVLVGESWEDRLAKRRGTAEPITAKQ
jgi:predicted LPLAT superfamily acyltransferase